VQGEKEIGQVVIGTEQDYIVKGRVGKKDIVPQCFNAHFHSVPVLCGYGERGDQ
jgi:hypothetical protein